MPAERDHRRRKKKRYTLVLLPESEAGKPKRLTTGVFGFVTIGIGILVLAVGIVVGALVYTPVGLYLPIPNPELENRYHRQVVEIQTRLTEMTEGLAFLREYNIRLRKALGERLSPEDSAFIGSAPLEPRTEPTIARDAVAADTRVIAGDGSVAETEFSETKTPSAVVKGIEVELPLMIPVRGYVTQEFRPDQQHFGIDFAGRVGTMVVAPTNGSVIFSGWTYDDGYMIMIAHGSGYRTTYKHNETLLKSAGEYVRRGEPIALLGNSGKTSYGPHLHFEVWKDGTPLNPREFLLTY